MALKRWLIGKPDREKAKVLAQECDIDPFAALIACGRGITDTSELELLISQEPLLCDPRELADIQKAAKRINAAITSGEKIAVFGDYDCDGIVSTAIMYTYLSSKGADVVTYIPDRISEGYGMNCAAVEYLHKQGIKLIITVDNGISCFREIEYANSFGIDTVVTDHHLPPDILPPAYAVVDPHRRDCPSSFKEVCGAQVAFKVICVADDKEPEQLLPLYADLLSVAVIGDVMPLVNENRSIVKAGIGMIQNSPRIGISAILNSAGIDRKTVNAGKISFGIVPRINAAGRMGDASRALSLLISNDMLNALNFANELDEENAKRQQTERNISAEAFDIIETSGYMYDRVIVVSGENWHPGIIGIVASRISDRYGKPAIVISVQEGAAHGSGRSISGFHLYNALKACDSEIQKYGGHELAAGLSLAPQNISSFRESINRYAADMECAVPALKIDFCINPAAMSIDMAESIKILEPFGMGNSTPVFGILGVKLEKISPVSSGKHLRLLFSKNDTPFQAMLFGVTREAFCFEQGDLLDLAVTLDTNFYKDQNFLSVQIKALRMSGIDQEAVFSDAQMFDDFMSGIESEYQNLLPDRAQVGRIYKYIMGHPCNEDRIKHLFMADIGYGKTIVSVKTLRELGLAAKRNGTLYGINTGEKTNLLQSATYKKLIEGGEKQ